MTVVRNQKGSFLLSAIVAMSIGAMGVFFYSSTITSARRQAIRTQRQFLAQTYASELLELFISLSADKLQNYMATNPLDETKAAYKLCDFVNQLDRGLTTSVAVINNPDPLADLPQLNHFNPSSFNAQPSRYYRIDKVDKITLAVDDSVCGQTLTQVMPLDEVSAFYVSVYVSWVPVSQGTGNEQTIHLSALIPN